jgi:acyl-CoA hydrolase
MPTSRVPPWLGERLRSHEEALAEALGSGMTVASGFATSEPHSFYARVWDHIRERDLTDLEFRQALFLAPHPLIVGDELHLQAQEPDDEREKPVTLLGSIGRTVRRALEKADDLGDLARHLDELTERRIRFVSAFLSPVCNTVVPDNALTRVLQPDLAGRNRARTEVLSWQSVHFPDAPDSMVLDAEGEVAIDRIALVMTPPDARGRLSHGAANGANAELLELALARSRIGILLYLNAGYPFTVGHPESPNTVDIERFRPAAEEGRLWVVEDDAAVPALPPGAFDRPSEAEGAIADLVAGHIEENPELTRGRALQIGIGAVGVQVARRLADSSWSGRSYTEMLDPFMLRLWEAGKIAGSHFVLSDGRREPLDGKLVCTFALGEAESGFYDRLDGRDDILLSAASRVVIPEAFYGGMGVNNILGIDFAGHVNATGRDLNPYSGVGGAATIVRGLGRGGVAYFCLKSTHHTPEGELRSSIAPLLPRGTPVSLIGPDLWGTREGARFYLATEHGIARINAMSQDSFVRAIVSVAHPDFRDDLAREAWDLFRIRIERGG